MGLDEVFAAADAELSAAEALMQAAREAVSGQEGRLGQVLEGNAVPLGCAAAERQAAEAEAAWLSALPGLCSRTAAILEGAKPFYLLAPSASVEEAPRPKGLFGFLSLSRKAKEAEPQGGPGPAPETAQAAFAGREKRLAAVFRMVDEATEGIARRRAVIEKYVFRFQEAALAAGRAFRDSPPEAAARAVFPAEEMATVLADHSAALALHARVLSAVDRTPQGIEDEIAEAAEAAMDRLIGQDEAA